VRPGIRLIESAHFSLPGAVREPAAEPTVEEDARKEYGF
jgi:hypothetical protein